VGFVDLKKATGLDFLPAGFRGRKDPRSGGGKDVLLVQVSSPALKSLGPEAIEERLHAMGVAVVSSVPERGLVLVGEDAALRAARSAEFVEASAVYPPGFKLDPTLGTTPLISKLRAASREMDLVAEIWPGFSSAEVLSAARAALGADLA